MCGIAGFIDYGGQLSDGQIAATVTSMTEKLRHRGPDAGDTWVDNEARVALGHRRLAIIDLSPQGRQPMTSADGRYVIVFNGEIYNYPAIRKELEEQKKQPAWRGHSDTEVILTAVTAWGVAAAVKKFVGMFAFALWDRRERKLYLARDRMGEKPLYYGWHDGTLLFASELKALRAHPLFRPQLDRGAVALYLRHSYIPAPYSIYKGIRKLPPGTILTIEGGTSDSTAYWSLKDLAENSTPFTGEERENAVDILEAALREAVKLQMISDVPLGAFLSGGVDSSTIVALMQSQSGEAVKTFSIGFMQEQYDEAKYAKEVAKHLGTDHTELYVTPQEAMTVIPRLARIYDEPFADSSQIPTILVSELARSKVTVSLSGDGGDELFGGYTRYFWGDAIWRRIRLIPQSVRRVTSWGIKSVPLNTWNSIIGKSGTLIPAFRQSHPGNKIYKLAHLMASETQEEMYKSLVSQWQDPQEIISAAEHGTVLTNPIQWPSVNNFPERMMYFDMMSYLPDDILVKVDRAAMSVSLETRVPFLDHRLIELAWRMPLNLKITETQGKWLLRQVLYRYVPAHIIERPKMGFGVPIEHWLRNELRDWAESLIDPKTLSDQGLFHAGFINTCWQEHLTGKGSWHHGLWNILMFQAWLAENKDVAL